jgi:uncharacterized membrane protein
VSHYRRQTITIVENHLVVDVVIGILLIAFFLLLNFDMKFGFYIACGIGI